MLVLYEAFVETLQGEAVAYVQQASEDLLRVGALAGLEAVLIEKTYSSLSAVLKTLSAPVIALEAPARQTTICALWSAFAAYFDAGRKAYVRQCVAEVWSVLLRRTRGETARRLVGIMVAHANTDNAAIDPLALAAVFSEAMKGAPGLLHSRAMAMYTDLVCDWFWPTAATSGSAAGSAPAPAAESSHQAVAQQDRHRARLDRTVDLLTTALVHHGSAEALRPVHDLALELLRDAASGTSKYGSLGPAQQACAMHLVGTLTGVRKGQRVPSPAPGTSAGKSSSTLGQYMAALVALLPSLGAMAEKDGDEAWTTEFLRAAVALLVAGKLADWIQGGKALIDGFWATAVSVQRGVWHQTTELKHYNRSPSRFESASSACSSNCSGRASSSLFSPTSPSELSDLFKLPAELTFTLPGPAPRPSSRTR